MTFHSKLNLTDKTKAAMLASPEARGRQKILEAIDNQIAAANGRASGSIVTGASCFPRPVFFGSLSNLLR